MSRENRGSKRSKELKRKKQKRKLVNMQYNTCGSVIVIVVVLRHQESSTQKIISDEIIKFTGNLRLWSSLHICNDCNYSRDYRSTKSSMRMEAATIAVTLRWLSGKSVTTVIIVTDSQVQVSQSNHSHWFSGTNVHQSNHSHWNSGTNITEQW